MSKHVENGRYWASQAIARRNAGDQAGYAACHANAAHYARLAIDERLAANTRKARDMRAWNGGGRNVR